MNANPNKKTRTQLSVDEALVANDVLSLTRGAGKVLTPRLRDIMVFVLRKRESELSRIVQAVAAIPDKACEPNGPPWCPYEASLLETPEVSIWLLQWPVPYPGTPIHDHGGSVACVCVLDGIVKETYFDANAAPVIRQLPTGRILTLPSTWIHKFEDLRETQKAALSLHIYSPPLTSMNYYKSVGGQLVKRGGWHVPEDSPAEQPSTAATVK